MINKVRSQTSRKTFISEKELSARLPDTGPLKINNYEQFKRGSKIIFYEKWNSPQSHSKTGASLSDFVKLQLLGFGSFGFVTLVRHEPSKDLYALKCVDKEEIVRSHQVVNLRTEQQILECINHPFTVYLFHSFKDSSYIYFVLPFVEGGDLYGHMQMIGEGHEDNARFYASQVILALEYLHYLDFVYRDLKPENILIDRTGYLKLSDFGFAKRLKRRLRTYTLCGTPEYIAPEVIQNKGYGKAVDWWAAGCFIYELVAGRTPFVASDAAKIYEKIVTGKYTIPKSFSPELKDLVSNLLQNDLSKRYGNLRNGVSDIKGHKWLVSINWLAVFNRRIEPPYKPRCPSIDLERTSSVCKLPKEGRKDKYVNEFLEF